MWLIFLATVLGSATAQYVKTANYGVKGGYGGQGHQYNAGESQFRYFNTTQQSSYDNSGVHYSGSPQQQIGICYIEVPTATLVKDPSHVPAGNGSRSDLSRIRSCCSGYIRNIHNYDICDPICTEECVNALCTAPDVCTCFPDHVKNAAGFCIATCPIGCQNGHCAGGECICKDGYKLDSDSKYCLPSCRDNCGGVGNCTAPNTCTCKAGFQSTPDGSCKVTCDKPCDNGVCVAPNDCRCNQGYNKDQSGLCQPHCTRNCGPRGLCISPNVCSNPPTGAPGDVNHGSSRTPTPYNQTYPSSYAEYLTNYSSNHPQSPDNQRPYHGVQQNYPSYSSPYYPTGNQPAYNISSDSQVKPNYPNNPNSQSPYGAGSGYPSNSVNQTSVYPEPNGQHYSGFIVNQTGSYYPSGPNQSLNPSSNSNPNQHQSYYPYYPSSNNPTGSPSNPNQQGYYPGQPNQPGYNPNQPNQPGYSPNQSSYPGQPHQSGYNPSQPGPKPSQPNQPGYQPNQPNQPGYNPNQPGYQPNQPNQPGYNPNQPGYQPNQPNQPGYYPNQPGYQPNQPNQPGYNPNQPSYQPNQPNQPGYNPNQPDLSNQPNMTNPYQHLFSSPLPIYPYPSNPNAEYQPPYCSQPCINGRCVEANRCGCNPGYVQDDADPTGTRCIPYCQGGCHNGVCSAPNFCICNMGYRKEQGVKGKSGCVKRIR